MASRTITRTTRISASKTRRGGQPPLLCHQEDTMEEIWKDIPGYEGKYQASSAGRVRSVDHYVRCGPGGTRMRPVMGQILKPGRYCKSGHVSVVLGKGAAGSPVHQLVALAFLGPCPKGSEVLHADGNPKNNCVDNLRYGTRTENILDVYRQGKAWRKLTAKDALDIKRRLANGEMGSSIARFYNVSATTVSHIKHGRIFAWLDASIAI